MCQGVRRLLHIHPSSSMQALCSSCVNPSPDNWPREGQSGINVRSPLLSELELSVNEAQVPITPNPSADFRTQVLTLESGLLAPPCQGPDWAGQEAQERPGLLKDTNRWEAALEGGAPGGIEKAGLPGL
ncbi:hypothetical protein NQZ68_005254 [Dissostichus eleginoides]|nr:hypothetical protein NQZ68_005254 [Dissostichus eleginoides]